MKRIIKPTIKTTIRTIATLACIMICACLFETIKVNAAEPAPESIIDMTQITDFVVNESNLQLYFNDGTAYYWDSDIDSDNEIISTEYAQHFNDSYIDMNTVTDFDITEYGLMLYLSDSSGYYWERQV